MPASQQVRLGRKRPLPSCPNPLFLQWLTELRDDAKEKGLKLQYVYQKAISSLNKYPLPLQNAKEAKILQSFGDGICKILDQKLQRYLRENGPDAPIHSLPEGAPPAGRQDNNSLDPSRKKNAAGDQGKNKGGGRKKREYIPQRRSGGYAVLLTLYRVSQIPGSKGYMFKMELQAEAQQLCDKSFTVPDLGSKYTAWSSVSTLIQKNLVMKTHNPARYSLTEEGLALGERLESLEGTKGPEGDREEARSEGNEQEEGEEGGPGFVDLTVSDDDEEEKEEERIQPTERPTSSAQPRVVLPGMFFSGKPQNVPSTSRNPNSWSLLPGSYEIILCVDFIETTGGSKNCKQDLVKELQRNGVTFDVRKLNVGDFLWVAREKVAPIPGQLRTPVGRELVLDYIIERKRMDDLCGSIIDGRFREQKFRLKRCGLRNPCYLVEECGKAASHLSLPETTLQQAIINTQVVDRFFVKRVQDVRESMAYLTVMTRYLNKLYQNCTLTCRSRELEREDEEEEEERGTPPCSLISFAEFNHGAIKNKCQTVKEVFARQLMQVSGLSGDKAAAILELYSTPLSLLTAYERCAGEADKEKLLSSIRYGKLKRNLGPALSRTVYQLYCTQGALT
ncbi:crossover junction endonuclease MUS81 isoform X1 [Trematomus bernacchii]|uniref:crossover junction endonuclease MUS81 isoform X1 n=1 Tax=Trematomus bernacchii TaxID=40690 RepID=UPI00146D5821|nr:crossover junction endonuclease MUS81 isoform X1 [Trematomus bernacchii]XP_034006123.1 crossover junction endonuclease MUS81 isoform X1 [Trematomus bernacchii]